VRWLDILTTSRGGNSMQTSVGRPRMAQAARELLARFTAS
jgi:hypothetical protein